MQVVKGQVTEIFKRHPLPYMAHASFSLLYTDLDASSRTLDLTCRTEQEFELWFWGLQVGHCPTLAPAFSYIGLRMALASVRDA